MGAPPVPTLIARARSRAAAVLMARGEHDPMNTDAERAALEVPGKTLAGLGHNAHVQDPAATAALLDGFR